MKEVREVKNFDLKKMEGETKETEDIINHPKHYENCSLECIDLMQIIFGQERVMSYCLIAAYKYLHRYKFKNGAEDLGKAMWYIDKCKELMVEAECLNDKEEVTILNRLETLLHKVMKEEGK